MRKISEQEFKEILSRVEANHISTVILNLNWPYDNFGKKGIIDDKHAIELATSLSKNTTTEDLRLMNHQIGYEGAKAIADMLSKNNTITRLDLHFNKIGDEGAKALGEMLSKNNKLSILNLTCNQIGDKGLKKLGKGLEKNAALSELELCWARPTTKGTKILVEKLVNNNSMLELGLAYCEISDTVKIQKDKLLKRNLKLLRAMQVIACKLLRVNRLLNYKASPTSGDKSLSQLPLEIREHIISYCDEHKLLTAEQKRKITLYAHGEIVPVADKLKFFALTDCNRVMRKVEQDKLQQLAPDDGIWDNIKESFTSGMQFLSRFPWVVPDS